MFKTKNFEWGGIDCSKLAEEFGTPLYVYDEEIIKSRCREIREKFLERWENTWACYASKAFSTKAIARLILNEGLGIDAISLGEIHTALSAGFPAEKIELHGNAKSYDEIFEAVKYGIGRIIVDSEDELNLISEISKAQGKITKILLRISPGVKAHTHDYISTGHTGSKFGFPIESEMLKNAVKNAILNKNIDLMGLHFHVGSQLFESEDHIFALKKIVKLMSDLKRDFDFETREINFGGGFGAVINPKLPHVPLEVFTDSMMELLTQECKINNLKRPRAIIEPGRWIVSESGITIYKVEVVKKLPEVTYIAVDGGMADNPRFELYNAKYEAVLINNPDGEIYIPENNSKVSIVGKCCESGDILIEDAKLPKVKRGDLIALYNTGAYTFSMASNYNRLLRPAVVFVNKGNAKLVVRRQTIDDLLSCDL